MPQKITISLMFHADKANIIQAELGRYGEENGIEILGQEFDYISGWSDFKRVALYGGNLDISEIGSTWLHDFAAMKVFRPFSTAEIEGFGGAQTFVPSVWASGTSQGSVWAIPWMIDLSLVYYRRDLLAKAGVKKRTLSRRRRSLSRPSCS